MHLQELCLVAICKSFDWFYYVYNTTNNDDMRLRFKFLQKFYSSEFIPLLRKEKYYLPDSYADLVFSKYLKTIETKWLSGFCWKTIVDTFTRIGPSLEHVIFSKHCNGLLGDPFSEDSILVTSDYNTDKCVPWQSVICFLPNVKTVTYRKGCLNGIVECIAKYCSKLETLSLSVSEQCCPHLNQSTVNIYGEYIQCNENDSFPMIHNLKAFTIKSANLSNPHYCKAVCLILAASSNLENIHFKQCKSFSSETKIDILKCCEQQALKVIDFSGSPVETVFIKDVLLTCLTLEALNVEVYNLDLKTHLCSIAQNMPNRPKLSFTRELLSIELSDISGEFVEISSESDELSDFSDSSMEWLSTSGEFVEISSDSDELSDFSDSSMEGLS